MARSPVLVALDLPPGERFVDELRRAWDDGDAVLPVDPRLPPTARDRLLDQLRPALVVDAEGGRTSRPDARPVEPGDALVVATSGSTGTPKGVVLTHVAVAAAARITSDALAVDPGVDRWLCCLPLAHVGGLGVVTRALITGTPLEVHASFDAAAVMAAARERGATRTSLVATALARIDPSAFATILLGGGAPPEQVPRNVVTTYGMTETGGGVVYDGRPLAGVEVRAVDGELHIRSATLLRAYRGPDADTDPRDAHGWFATDDAGEVDGDGRVRVLGRRGDVIVTGGEKVWPDPVEAIVARHPAVAEVAIVGRQDPEWGTRVVAIVALNPGCMPPELDELRALVRAELPPYCAPQTLEIVRSLPRTALGKVRRDLIRTAHPPA